MPRVAFTFKTAKKGLNSCDVICQTWNRAFHVPDCVQMISHADGNLRNMDFLLFICL